MGDTWIADLTHFLDERGKVPAYSGSKRIANHLGSIVTALTGSPTETPRQVPVPCRRRPKRKACPGMILAGFEPGTPKILWGCPVCHDRGIIHNWQGTLWDRGGARWPAANQQGCLSPWARR